MKFATLVFIAAAFVSSVKVEPYTFALIGDAPYAPRDSVWFDAVIDQVNADDSVQWVIHAGDIKTGGQPCTDAVLEGRLAWFNKFDDPFILTPGDNGWTDCHRNKAGRFDPLDRLAKLRSLFYPEVGLTVGGRPMRVTSQAEQTAYAEFSENVRWVRDGVHFATVHIVGSRNGTAPFQKPDDSSDKPPAVRTAEHDDEVERRTSAGIAWLRETFAHARAGKGVFVSVHAGMGLERRWESDPPHYAAFLDVLREETEAFGRPVVMAHGDSHYFRIDKPLRRKRDNRRLWNFTRVETFGAGDVNWIEVTVDPESDNVFSFDQRIAKKQ